MEIDEIARGKQAQELFDNPIIKEAFDKLEALYKEEIFLTKVEDDKERKSIFLCYNTLATVKAHLREVMQTGELATASKNDTSTIF